MATTLLQLRTSCKYESDNVNQSFIADAEWNDYIGRSYNELYGILVESFGNDYFTQTPSTGYTFTTTGTSNFFALPTDFFKLLGVDLQVSSPQQYVTLRPFNFSDRNQLSVYNSPIPQAGQLVRVWYVPRATLPVADVDTIDGVNGWEEYIVVDACIKAMGKEESDVQLLLARKQALLARITSEAENRDAGNSATTADTRFRGARSMRYRLNGNNLWLIGNGSPGFGPWGDWGPYEDLGYW